jgi:hypothetical protein
LRSPFFSPLVCFVFRETNREFHAPPVIRFVFLRWNLFQARASGSSYCSCLSLMDCCYRRPARTVESKDTQISLN